MSSSPTSNPLAGRVALVTGVSRRQGIGAGLTRRLLADGASVLASGWEPHDAEMTWGADPGGASALLEDLGGVGPSLHYMTADLERPEAAAELVDATIDRFGKIDMVTVLIKRSFDDFVAWHGDQGRAPTKRRIGFTNSTRYH